MSGIHTKFEVASDQFLSDLTQAAYKVALKHGFKASFVDVQLDLYEAMCRVIQKDMMASPACGQAECRAKAHYEVTSPEGKEIFKSEEL